MRILRLFAHLCGMGCLLFSLAWTGAQAQTESWVKGETSIESTASSTTSDLGIFTTPEQRALLDRLRQNYLANLSRDEMIEALTNPPNLMMPLPELEVFDPKSLLESLATPKRKPQPLQMELGGMVEHNDGSFTVWLNGVRYSSGSLPDRFELARVNGVTGLKIRFPHAQYFVKPGQQIELLTGEIAEGYEPALVPPVLLGDPELDVDAETAALALGELRSSEEP